MKKGIREGEREVGGDGVCGCSFGEPLKLISWRPVLVVEKPEYPERTTAHGQATGTLYHLRL
jgi:hypothetical protein